MNFFALQLLFFAFAYRCGSARLGSSPCLRHAMAAPSISVRRLCRSQRVEAAPCHCVAEHRKAPLCHRLSPRCGTMPLRFISWRYRALPLPRLSSLGNALALLWYATFCLALARLIASIRSNAVALLLETVLCSCSTSHVDALPLQGVTVRG